MGWKREASENGIIISLQLLTPESASRDRHFDHVSIALNDRQLRSLTRDLQRAATERGIQLWAVRKWRGFQ